MHYCKAEVLQHPRHFVPDTLAFPLFAISFFPPSLLISFSCIYARSASSWHDTVYTIPCNSPPLPPTSHILLYPYPWLCPHTPFPNTPSRDSAARMKMSVNLTVKSDRDLVYAASSSSSFSFSPPPPSWGTAEASGENLCQYHSQDVLLRPTPSTGVSSKAEGEAGRAYYS